MAVAIGGTMSLAADDLDRDALRDTFGQIDIVNVTAQRRRAKLFALWRVPREGKIHWRLRPQQSAYRSCI
jgi:hypothetical protein